jgi:2-polyprenyl-3-methyl-5-hydroxy-6-metoxy-1,4-benzoquinol methylase
MTARCLDCSHELCITAEGLFDTRFGIDQTYGLARCSHCSLEQTLPLPEPSELNRLYREHYNFGGEHGTLYTRLRERFYRSSLYSLWLLIDGDVSFHRQQGQGRLLDLGCNEGRGLRIYRSHGFDAEGLEPNEKAANAARAAGFRVYTEYLEDFQPGETYDVVILSNVLEHSLNPKMMLRHVSRILRSRGRLWISCPNGRSLFRSIFGNYWINFHVPFHITHFSDDTLQQLLTECGFKITRREQCTPALWVANSLVARLFARRGKTTTMLRNPFPIMTIMGCVRFGLFPLLWLANVCGKGDCIVVEAVKEELG